MKDENAQNELMSVCNFDVKVESSIDVINDQHSEPWIRIRMTFESGQDKTTELPLSDIEKKKWSDVDPRCILYPETGNVAVKIANHIRSQLSDGLPREVRYVFNSTGLHFVNDMVVFVAGDRVYTRSSDNNVHFAAADNVGLRLDIDESITLADAFNGVVDLILLAPRVGWVLIAHTISGIIRESFVKVGFTPNATLMIVGKSGMLKSSYVPQITQLYNRSDGAKANTRFNSSTSFIEDSLYKFRHCTYVIDDIHTGSSSGIQKNNETTAEEIIRRISDNIGRGIKNGKKAAQRSFECNVVFIGEYTFGVESTASRMLCVELTQKIDGMILDKYQRDKKLLVSTFYFHFIQWYVDNFKNINDRIGNELTAFRASGTLSHVHGRLADTLFYLRMSFMILFQFCIESKLMTLEQATVFLHLFEHYVRQLIDIQQNRSGLQDVNSEYADYLSLIREQYQTRALNVAKNKDEFDDDFHDGVIHYECLCLRGDSLKKIVKQNDLKPLTDYLNSLKALKLGSNGGSTVQISGLNGIRFYAIWLDKLNLK